MNRGADVRRRRRAVASMGGALVLLAAPVVQAGRDYSSLPHGMNDKISSIQVLGDAEVTVFQDARDKHR